MAKRSQPYKVGYGRPPRESRFKPGVSGNPKGRPKGSLNAATTLNKVLKELVVIVENGRKKKITKFEAAIMQLTRRAMTGDHNAIKLLLALVSSAEQRAEIETPPDRAMSRTEKKLLQNMLKRSTGSGEGNSNE